MKTVEQAKEKVDADIERIAEIDGEIDQLTEMIDKLDTERSKIKERLFEQRPLPFAQQLLFYLESRAESDPEYANRHSLLIFLVREWVEDDGSLIQSRFDRSNKHEKAMLAGEFDPYA